MKVNEIKNVERVPLAVDYRRMYRGEALITVGASTATACPIEFVLELSPFGTNEVSVTLLGQTDYPVVPAMKLLKGRITEMDRAGELP
ncbi:MAG: hypothetical protein EA427_09345 [Spirochaetaceae bacterium]|nr:MAG: hypothetical protein EA427_09345 [Spirochaetaceae bacterium]